MREPHFHLRVRRAKPTHQRRHGVDRESGERDEIQMARDHAGDCFDLGPHRVEGPHDLPGRGHERLAGRRQRRPTTHSAEQLDTELASPEIEQAFVAGEVKTGDALTRIKIPKIKVDVVVVEGTTQSALRALRRGR